jgi:hypothetical protein
VNRRRITCPLLSVTASDDRLVLPAVGEQIAVRYGGDHLRVDGGHYALVGEPGWRATGTRVVDWLDQAVDAPGRERRRREAG